MIDWHAAGAYVTALTGADAAGLELFHQRVARGPEFRNKEFPLSPLPLLLTEREAAAYARQLESYGRLLDRIVDLYRSKPAVRAWFSLGPTAEQLVLADTGLDGHVVVCRVDGYLTQGTETPVVLENNADAPAGTLFTARVNNTVHDGLDAMGVYDARGVCGSTAVAPPLSPLTYTDEHALLAALRSCDARRGGTGIEHLAVLQPAGGSNRESVLMAESFRTAGLDAYLADPRDLRLSHGRVFFGDKPADACWNKVNTTGWCALVEADEALAGRWLRAVSDTGFVNVNPFGARYVAENKLALALPQEPDFAALFTDGERALAATLLPWARRLAPGTPGRTSYALLTDELLDQQHAYVLKEPYDIRGDGVTVGRAVSRSTWEKAVARGLAEGHLVQEYVAPVPYPVLRDGGTPAVVPMATSLDGYVMNGEFRGFGAKASLQARVNVFQGGQKLAVHVLGERARPA
ncbi:hypothetical protein BLA24_31015 [Streptomyces cinnamoneus]|uniref:Circularly permuted type 2 ATP-grasp protein n=1 Tax=Streptomyces cinnamoneus TaxID=53446 RepID=A0A2G1X9N7_STRCJ|nr:hypothetical protein [Streptomyces cinnamoneus]PHQ47933.1 hypothetical protein BLA24_31015 [Streptomyces cinnamoneus]PPT15558.1 hypothetical protein CYQ11_24115 [Streptomyces cinnamoneus]